MCRLTSCLLVLILVVSLSTCANSMPFKIPFFGDNEKVKDTFDSLSSIASTAKAQISSINIEDANAKVKDTFNYLVGSISYLQSQTYDKVSGITLPNAEEIANKYAKLKDSFDSVVASSFKQNQEVSVITMVFDKYDESMDWSAEQMATKLNIPHEDAKKIIKITALSVTGGVVVALIVPTSLSVLGFTAGGVRIGSIATSVQSIFYGGQTAGLFSMLQSAGVVGISTFSEVTIAAVSSVGFYEIFAEKFM